MKRPLIIAFVLVAFAAVAQTISYFNQGFLRQGTAQLDRDYLGIYGSNIGGWGPNPPWMSLTNLFPAPSTNFNTNVWYTYGNAVANTNEFIGSTNNQPLTFKVWNQRVGLLNTNWSVAFGTNALALADSSLALARNARASGNGSSAVGYNSIASGVAASALGGAAVASGSSSTAIGIQSKASGQYSIDIGAGSEAAGLGSVGIGYASFVDSGSDYGLALGNSAYVLNDYGIAIGNQAYAGFNGSCVIVDDLSGSFFGATDTGPEQFVLGFQGGGYAYTYGSGFTFADNSDNVALQNGIVYPDNGVVQMLQAASAAVNCSLNHQFYCLSGTNQLVKLLSAASVPNVIYRFSSTNRNGSFIVTNATGTQTIRDGTALSYTNFGVGEIGFISDGANWWLASKGKTELPNASYSTSTNTTFPLITNTITLQNIDHGGANQGIGLDNSAWWTFGVGSRIWITNSGDYMLSFSAVWAKGAGSPSNGDIWLRKNGTDVANTATIMTIQQNATNVMTVNLFLTVTSPAYFDLQGASTDGNGLLQALPAITSPFKRPAMPSIIVTVNKISD